VVFKGNLRGPGIVYTWSVRWMQAQRDLAQTREERIAACTEHQKRMKDLRESVRTLVKGGEFAPLPPSEEAAAEWYLAEAELWLLKERGK
jgi:hypothetical protein